MNASRAPLGGIVLALAMAMGAGVSAQPPQRGDAVELELALEPCVMHLEARLREIIAIELRTSARVDEHAGASRFRAWVRCVEGGVVLVVRSSDADAPAEQHVSAAALRGPDPARTLALSIVELLEPALAEAEADTETLAEQAAVPLDRVWAPSVWRVAAALVFRPGLGTQPHAGGLRVRALRRVGNTVRVEFGGHLEVGARRVSLGRVRVSSLALDASLVVALARMGPLHVGLGAGMRLGGLLWRGRANASDVDASRLPAAHVDALLRVVFDGYLSERWALRGDFELAGVVVGSRAAVVDGAEVTRVSVAGVRLGFALGLVHAF